MRTPAATMQMRNRPVGPASLADAISGTRGVHMRRCPTKGLLNEAPRCDLGPRKPPLGTAQVQMTVAVRQIPPSRRSRHSRRRDYPGA